jgi:hypothetical protein
MLTLKSLPLFVAPIAFFLPASLTGADSYNYPGTFCLQTNTDSDALYHSATRVKNNSTTTDIDVECPLVGGDALAITNGERCLEIGYVDNTSESITCTAHYLDAGGGGFASDPIQGNSTNGTGQFAEDITYDDQDHLSIECTLPNKSGSSNHIDYYRIHTVACPF